MKEETNKVKSHWNERWVKFEKEGYETKRCDYYISDHGRIKSVYKTSGTERLMNGSKNNYDFIMVPLKLRDNKFHTINLHIFVAEHFVPKEENDEFVVHIDCNKANNHYKNLKWYTKEDVVKLRTERGHYDHFIKGIPGAKLTESKVRMLKRFLKNGKTKKTILAKQFGITTMQINRIERGENWGYVKI